MDAYIITSAMLWNGLFLFRCMLKVELLPFFLWAFSFPSSVGLDKRCVLYLLASALFFDTSVPSCCKWHLVPVLLLLCSYTVWFPSAFWGQSKDCCRYSCMFFCCCLCCCVLCLWKAGPKTGAGIQALSVETFWPGYNRITTMPHWHLFAAVGFL